MPRHPAGIWAKTLLFVCIISLFPAHVWAVGTISGRLTNASDSGIANIPVDFYVEGVAGSVYRAYTNTEGYYTASNLPAGSYRILFMQGSDIMPFSYIWEYYNDRHALADADWVVLTDGAVLSNIDAQVASVPADPYEPNESLAGAYTITAGTYNNIVGTDDGTDYDWFKIYLEEGQDLRVAVHNGVPIFPDQTLDIDIGIYDGSGNALTKAISSRADEVLYMANASAGWYYVFIEYAYPSVFSLTATVGDLDIGEITGHVTNSIGYPVQNVQVNFYAWDNLAWALIAATAVTDSSGSYRFAFTPGNYRAEFDVGYANDYFVIGEWYSNQSAAAASAVVPIVSGQTIPGIDAQLADGGAISGHVSDQGNAPLFSR